MVIYSPNARRTWDPIGLFLNKKLDISLVYGKVVLHSLMEDTMTEEQQHQQEHEQAPEEAQEETPEQKQARLAEERMQRRKEKLKKFRIGAK